MHYNYTLLVLGNIATIIILAIMNDELTIHNYKYC